MGNQREKKKGISMNQFILIERIKVQNANAISGFTWGFPAITHFLGFVHNLSFKLVSESNYQDITLAGCAVIAHEHKVHTYGKYERMFTQSRNPPYLPKHVKNAPPPVIEEGKMNMTVSLLIGYKGNIGNRENSFKLWLRNACLIQRLSGGTILNIADISFFSSENSRDVRLITRRILPGFVLLDRSEYLEEHYKKLVKENPDAELLDAWLDFSALKQKARPKSDLISKSLHQLVKNEPDNTQFDQLLDIWNNHLEKPYQENEIPKEMLEFFNQVEKKPENKHLMNQWKNYCEPDYNTDADWQYIKKPQMGYLVPIMIGYKAISRVYKNEEVSNTRDNKTDVCFVEAAHSIVEWQSTHHLKTPEQLQKCLWHYHYEENWYLCRQGISFKPEQVENSGNEEDTEDIYS